MKNVKSLTRNTLNPTCELDALVEYGRQLHSEAVFRGVLKIIQLFRYDVHKTAQLEKNQNQGNLKYSH